MKLWQIIVLVVVTIGTAGGVYGIYRWVTGPSAPSLPANTQLVPVQYGDLVNSVSASGSLIFPTKEGLTFGSAGTVEEVNVREGDTVEEGQVLAKLDSASLTSLEKAVAQARINLSNAQDSLEKAQNPYTEADIAQAELAIISAQVALNTAQDNLEKAQNPYSEADIAQAEATVISAQVALNTAQENLEAALDQAETAVIDAKAALKTAQDNLEKTLNPYSEADIAQAELAIIHAKVALKTAQDNLEKAQNPYSAGDMARAEAQVETARVNLDNARQDLADTQKEWKAKIEEAEGRLSEAIDAYKGVFRRYFGMKLTGEQVLQEPDAIFAQANIDPVFLFNMRWHYSMSEAEEVLQDLASESGSTWNPSTVLVWQYLFPEPPTGEDIIDEAREAWEALMAVKDEPDVARLRTAKAIATSEGKVAQAEDSLTQAEETLAEMKADPDPLDVEQKQKQVVVAQANLAKAEQTLAEMKAGADPLNVEQKQKQVAVAQANLAKAEQTLAKMQAGADPLDVEQKQKQLVIAQANLAKTEQTLAEMQAGADPLNVAQKQKQLVIAQANLAEAEERLAEMLSGADPLEVELKQSEAASAQAALDEALRRLEMTTLVAPFAGIVTMVNVEAGQAVNASTVAVEIVDPSVVEVSAILDEIDVAVVKQGQRVAVSLDALPDLELSGEVSTIAAAARAQAGVVSYPVTIRMTPPSGVQLREGMSAIASIVVREVNNILLIPNQAISGSFLNPVVTVMVNGESQVRPVTLGASDELYTEVVAGLQEGELVVVEVATAGTTQQRFTGDLPIVPGGGVLPGGGMRQFSGMR